MIHTLPNPWGNPPLNASSWTRLKFLASMFFILHSSCFMLNSCGLDVEDSTPPSAPVWVQKSLPEEWPERGIDAHESGGIYLEWYPSSDEDIMAYHIYRAIWYDTLDSLGDYQLLTRMETESISSTEYIDEQVSTRVKYSYKLKAEDTSNNTGTFSDSIFYSILPQLNLEWMIPNGVSDLLGNQRMLSWEYGFYIELEDFCLTILTEANELISRRILQPINYVDEGESWTIPSDIVLNSNEVYQWRIDACANYQDGRETSGSESRWAKFLYEDL